MSILTPDDIRPEDDESLRAIVIHPVLPARVDPQGARRDPEDHVDEAIGLAEAISLKIVAAQAVNIRTVSPATLCGRGAQEEIGALAKDLAPDVVIINHALSPVQQRNLEQAWKVKVIDRTGLILEIFGARAQTNEGKIQVRLAALEYQKSRLVRSWTHLERQRATGKTGGPGEKQLEIDRRLISEQIAQLKKELEQVRRTRDLARRSRERVPFPIVALVGYTNAGKSTLFNRMTGAQVFAENLLFATLDPTMRRLSLPSTGQEVILADTVGFISDLPTHLVAAFRATLEQVQYADVILHVRDVARPDTEMQREDVISILKDLEVDYEHDPRVIEVLNKIDLLEPEMQGDIERRTRRQVECVSVSALTGEGVEALEDIVAARLAARRRVLTFMIPYAAGEALAWLHQHATVESRADEPEGVRLRVSIDPADLGRFMAHYSIHPLDDPMESKDDDDNQKQIHGHTN